MKKWIIGALLILLLSIISSYIFIPKNIVVSKVALIKCMPDAAFRALSQKDKWKNWLVRSDSNSFTDKENTYQIVKILSNAINVTIQTRNSKINSIIYIFPFSLDSVKLDWQCKIASSLNPIKRLQQYNEAVNIKKNMTDIFQTIKPFLENAKNIYDFNITRTTITDTTLVSVKKTLKNYPSTKDVYAMVDELKKYIADENAKETNYPMLNISLLENGNYEVMVAIPTDKALKGNGVVMPKYMIPYKDKCLTTEVQGGEAAINKAFNAIENYMSDHQLTAPVIPFQYLVTDRRKETDSTKWITKIYYPII